MAVHLVGQTELVWDFGQARPRKISQLLKNRDSTPPMREDVKKKHFPTPLREILRIMMTFILAPSF